MNDRSLAASFWTMIFLQTIGSVDMPGSGNRKMPAPHMYVSIVVAWAVLALVGDAGADKFARRLGWLMVLTGAVLGPFGARAVGFLRSISQNFAVAPPQTQPTYTP